MTVLAIGAQLFTLREFTKTPEDIRETFNRVRAMGYEAVQASALGAIDPVELAHIARDTGLQIVATHIAYDRIRDEPQAVIDDHHTWGCRHVAIGGLPLEFRNRDGFARFAVEASEAARPLIEADLTFSYHNHSFELERFDGCTGLEILCTESDPEVFSFEVDTYWIQHGGGNPVTWLNRLRDRMHIVHFKDLAMAGSKQLFAEVGEGNLEWPTIIAACKDAGIEWYLIEQDVCLHDPFDSLAMSLENLKSMGLD